MAVGAAMTLKCLYNPVPAAWYAAVMPQGASHWPLWAPGWSWANQKMRPVTASIAPFVSTQLLCFLLVLKTLRH